MIVGGGGGGLFILATFQIFASFAKKEKKRIRAVGELINTYIRGLGGRFRKEGPTSQIKRKSSFNVKSWNGLTNRSQAYQSINSLCMQGKKELYVMTKNADVSQLSLIEAKYVISNVP